MEERTLRVLEFNKIKEKLKEQNEMSGPMLMILYLKLKISLRKVMKHWIY